MCLDLIPDITAGFILAFEVFTIHVIEFPFAIVIDKDAKNPATLIL